MKTSFFVSFILLSFAAAGARADPVLDYHGEEVVTGAKYYVVSAIWGAGGGGVTLARTGENKCPLDVIQAKSDLNYGLPVVFSTPGSTNGKSVIHTSQRVNIKFVDVPNYNCEESTVWKVQGIAAGLVTIGGAEGAPESAFKIEKKSDTHYKIAFDTLYLIFNDVGITLDPNGFRRLVLMSEPFGVYLIKAEQYASYIRETAM